MAETDDNLPAGAVAEETLPANPSADPGAEDASASPGGGQPIEEPTFETLAAENAQLRADHARRSAEAQRQAQRAGEAEAELQRLRMAQMNFQQQQILQNQSMQQRAAPIRTEEMIAEELTIAQGAGDYGKVAAILAEQRYRTNTEATQNMVEQIRVATAMAAEQASVFNFEKDHPDLRKPESRLYQETNAAYIRMMQDPNCLIPKNQMQLADGRWIAKGILQAATNEAEAKLRGNAQTVKNQIADSTDTHIEISKPTGNRPGVPRGGQLTDKHLHPKEVEYYTGAKMTIAQYAKTLPPGNVEERIRQGRPVLPQGIKF